MARAFGVSDTGRSGRMNRPGARMPPPSTCLSMVLLPLAHDTLCVRAHSTARGGAFQASPFMIHGVKWGKGRKAMNILILAALQTLMSGPPMDRDLPRT